MIDEIYNYRLNAIKMGVGFDGYLCEAVIFKCFLQCVRDW